jgi:arylsulfatase
MNSLLYKALGAGLAGAAGIGTGAAIPPEDSRPDIVLILSDDMGFSDIGCYGGEIHTPNLDQLAAYGLRFRQFYNGARCCPTRASLITGLYPHQTGIGDMSYRTGPKPEETNPEGYSTVMNEHCRTIAEVLRPAGYKTYAVGKWHLAATDLPDLNVDNWPLQRGFDEFYGTIYGAGSFYDPALLTRGNTLITPFNDPDYQPDGPYYYTDAITDNAVQFIRQHGAETPDRPFFMYVAYTAAHWPMHAPEEDVAEYKGLYDGGYGPVRQKRFERLKELGLIDPDWTLSPQAGDWNARRNQEWETRCMEVYAAMIDRMDQGIGRILNALKKNGSFDNTLIFYLQDNGACAEQIGRNPPPKWDLDGVEPMKPDEVQTRIYPPMRMRDGRPFRGGSEVLPGPDGTYIAYGKNWANVSDTPFREYKHYVHEGGISTPFIACWPKRIQSRGGMTSEVGHIIDVMATCADAASAPYPKQVHGVPVHSLEGTSLMPVFTGGELKPRTLYWEHEGNRAVRDGNWKLVAKGPQSKWELYDMAADRTEMNNLADLYPERVEQMENMWLDYAHRTDVLPWPRGPYGSESALRKGQVMKGAGSPKIAGRGFRIDAEVAGQNLQGVILAQGGNRLGFTLYCMNGNVVFAVRAGAQEIYRIKGRLPDGGGGIRAEIPADGMMRLNVNGKPVAAGQGRLIPSRPGNGLACGLNPGDAVDGAYAAPFAFNGVIREVELTLL